MVYILLAPGFEEIEATAPYDILKRGGVNVKFASVGPRQVAGSHGMTVTAECSLEEVSPEGAELIVVPGGMRGVNNLLASPEAVVAVSRFYGAGKRVAAICAGPMVLSAAGVLEGRPAVCYPGLEDRMTGLMSQEKGTVTDGPVTTSRAAGTALDFGLELLRLLRGEKTAERVKNDIHYAG